MASIIATLGLLAPYIIPEAILDGWSQIYRFASFMSMAIPSIDHLSKLSSFPQLTRLYLSIMWATVPLQIAVFVIKPGGSFSVSHIRSKLLPITLLYLSLVPAIILFAVFLLGSDFGGNGGPYGRIVGGMANSKLILGLVSTVLVLAVSYFAASFVLWIKNWPRIYFGLN